MTAGRVLLASTLASQAPKRSNLSMTWGAVLAALAIAALASCRGEEARSPGSIPPSAPASAAPKHEWCEPCQSLPVASLGTSPRVSRRGGEK